MTDHLPECHTSMIPGFHNERWVCICAALRACEERVRQSILHHINQEFPKPTLGIKRVKQLLDQDLA